MPLSENCRKRILHAKIIFKRVVNLRIVPDTFDKFLQEYQTGLSERNIDISWQTWLNNNPNPNPNPNRSPNLRFPEYRNWVLNQLNQNRHVVDLGLERGHLEIRELEYAAKVRNLSLANGYGKIVIRNMCIGTLTAGDGIDVTLIDCSVNNLKIGDSNKMDFLNSNIGRLEISGRILQWSMKRGALLRLHMSARGPDPNPIIGTIELRKVYLPHDPSEFDVDPQEYRDARAFLLERNNTLAAAVFHSAELALDRHRESWANQFASWIYELMSDYGNSIARPLLWFLAIFVTVTTVGAIFDAIQTNIPHEELHGWQFTLDKVGWHGQLWRAATYALQSIINPFGIFSTKPLLVAKSPYWSIGLTLPCWFGTLSLALIVISLRRRFKLE